MKRILTITLDMEEGQNGYPTVAEILRQHATYIMENGERNLYATGTQELPGLGVISWEMQYI